MYRACVVKHIGHCWRFFVVATYKCMQPCRRVCHKFSIPNSSVFLSTYTITAHIPYSHELLVFSIYTTQSEKRTRNRLRLNKYQDEFWFFFASGKHECVLNKDGKSERVCTCTVHHLGIIYTQSVVYVIWKFSAVFPQKKSTQGWHNAYIVQCAHRTYYYEHLYIL